MKKGIREKLPFFVLSAAVAVITYAVQRSSGAVKAFTTFPPISDRERAGLVRGLYSENILAQRIGRLLSLPGGDSDLAAALAALVLAGISVLVWRSTRTRPYLSSGMDLVLGNTVARHRTCSGGSTSESRPVYVCPDDSAWPSCWPG